MAGMGLVAIKRRIKSITNTTKITRAMGLVATSKYKKIKDKVDISNNYLDGLCETIMQVKDNYEGDNFYIRGNDSSKKLYVVLTSDTGLCGGFNWSVVNEIIDTLKANKEECSVIVVGQKGRAIFKKLDIETVAEYVEILEPPSLKEATTIINHALNMYTSGEIGEIYIVYKKLISALKNEVKIEKILPLNSHNEENTKDYVDIGALDKKAIYEITNLYLSGKMLNSLLHSKASEHRARMESMGSATSNANDILDKLNLSYNRIRQSAITQEISEIVGGAEAQK
ncbi:ATP synthase F1 subunit gamma [Clostridium bowmanii]|uniref:ATP synthase F1 subunit gamma n=1 Tax=Clostridium bowmanii TaxID=132925 RepID=UPI001C0AAB04|nr:ATP synthase F1 subunit gamma [Clostridium bowmanii]MBU3189002.1 ATP synthase F1 subunit gamma [Clostridium bowmanii]MCA1073896.1 ATP synthase F1 subunit gamma [Clostridium bowmanii]